MTVIELKEQLIEKIRKTENEGILDHISDLFEFESEKIHVMSQGEIEAVNEGLKQIESRQSVSHDEIKRQTAEWLTR